MEIIKNHYIILVLLSISAIVFYLANNKSFFGKIANFFFPCVQNPEKSFPCYGSFDIFAMIFAIVTGVICLGILGYYLYKMIVS